MYNEHIGSFIVYTNSNEGFIGTASMIVELILNSEIIGKTLVKVEIVSSKAKVKHKAISSEAVELSSFVLQNGEECKG